DDTERDARGGRPDGQSVIVGGILSGVQRKVTRKGDPWAAATLEDLEGAIEVLFFPATYAGCATLLADDAIVCVRGRLDRRDDSPKLIAQEVIAPDLSAKDAGPFVVSMPVHRCVAPVVDRLQEVLRSHPGLAEVHLRLCNGNRTTVVKLDDKLRVRPSPSLIADLKQILGPACIA
ncbi:MAG: DNA polymerase III subunit alpha, partial [Actinobacteria bacterium]|nr:DNA polymerase III subunit alpha [Actinomycetota bacterium]